MVTEHDVGELVLPFYNEILFQFNLQGGTQIGLGY